MRSMLAGATASLQSSAHQLALQPPWPGAQASPPAASSEPSSLAAASPLRSCSTPSPQSSASVWMAMVDSRRCVLSPPPCGHAGVSLEEMMVP